MLGEKFRQKAADYSSKAAKAVSVQYMVFAAVLAQIVVFWLSAKGSLFPGEERFLSIVGTCAEIVAGLYGITLAGYTFFLSRIDGLCARDSTLDYVVSSIKSRFKYLIWFITVTVAATLCISVILMYYPVASALIPQYAYRLICNEFVLFLGFSVMLILYYSILVVDPNCLEKEAGRLKNKLDGPFAQQGSVAEFIYLYDRVESCCQAMLPRQISRHIRESKGLNDFNILGLLQQMHPQLGPLLPEVELLRRYYQCMVNCKQMSASRQMCLLARKVLAVLEPISSPYQIRENEA